MKTKLFQAVANLLAPSSRKSRVSNRNEPANVSATATVATLQSAIRQAEGGETRQLFALYRDLLLGDGHIQGEYNKRVLAVLSQPASVLPADKSKPDDLNAAAACKQLLADCDNWNDGLTHLLSSFFWPVSVVEKLFRPRNLPDDQPAPVPLTYTLKRLEPVNPTVLCFREQYTPAPRPGEPVPPETWEPDLRFWPTDADGRVLYQDPYPSERARHIVHRGHLLVGVRDCWGGPGRATLFWYFLKAMARESFGRGIERYGNPFPVVRTDVKDQANVTWLSDALALSVKIGGLVVDHDTQVELKEVAVSGLADAHERFINICNREISELIIGFAQGNAATPEGLNSNRGNQEQNVREDIRMFDQIKLGESIQKQLFAPFLKINGLRGAPPKIVWGGLSDADARSFADTLVALNSANLEPTDEAIPIASERLGFPVQRKAAQPAPAPGLFPAGERFAAGSPARLVTLAAQTRLADSLGVPPGWLNPLRDFLADLETKIADGSLTEQDLLKFLEAALARVPELFGQMDVAELAKALETGMGAAVLDTVRQGIKRDAAAQTPG